MEALEILGIDLKVIIVQIVGFLILFWVLNRFLFSRIKGMLTKRRVEIETAYEKNEAERQDIARLKEGYEERIAGIKLEAGSIVEEGRKKAEAIKQEILAHAEKDSRQLLEKSKREIRMEKEKAISEAHGQIADLSLIVASKLIKKSLSREDHLQLANEYLSEMGDLYEES
ncbi:MAG: F0F1 ATP synthase subunit B [Thermodesulfobacteriota bacterium]